MQNSRCFKKPDGNCVVQSAGWAEEVYVWQAALTYLLLSTHFNRQCMDVQKKKEPFRALSAVRQLCFLS